MFLLSRLPSLLLRPRTAWRRLADAPITTGALWRLLLLLALVPAAALVVGLSVLPVPDEAPTPWPLGASLPLAAGLYALLVAGVALVAFVARAVAATFGGVPDGARALRLAVLSSSAALLGGVFLAFPALSPLTPLVALHSGWLLYTGLPPVMRSAPGRTGAYAAVLALAGGVVGLLASGGLNHFAAREAQRVEAAALAGAPVLASAPPTAPAGPAAVIPGGDPDAGAIPATAFRALLPQALAGFSRSALEATNGQVAGRVSSNARATYLRGDQRLRVEMIDLGAMSKLMATAGAAVAGERENRNVAERTWQQDGRTLHESQRKDGSGAQYAVTLKNGVVVELDGQRMALDEVKAAAAQLDLGALEALQRAPVEGATPAASAPPAVPPSSPPPPPPATRP